MAEKFPDGTLIEDFFLDNKEPDESKYGKKYIVTDYGIKDDGNVYTEAFQKLIDDIYEAGGGAVTIPKGVYKTGALFFKQGVNLYLEEGGTLLGSDDIADYPVCDTRIEGESCKYFSALINAEGIDGFLLGGKGTIDGNGHKSWRAFWIRRKWNPNCTNKDEQRPRLIYLSNCKNAVLSGVTMQNSHFWTNHIYKCNHIKFLRLKILSPGQPVNAPSTDAIDIDVCSDVLVKKCYMAVNDDAVALKGGKGRNADKLLENGGNERIVIEDCDYGFCHSCLTFGSESIYDRNVIMRRIKVSEGKNIVWLKFRPDTPQHYEYCEISDIEGNINNFLNVGRWKQFADGSSIENPMISRANNFYMHDCRINCNMFYNVPELSGDFIIKDIVLRDISATERFKSKSPEFVQEKGLTFE